MILTPITVSAMATSGLIDVWVTSARNAIMTNAHRLILRDSGNSTSKYLFDYYRYFLIFYWTTECGTIPSRTLEVDQTHLSQRLHQCPGPPLEELLGLCSCLAGLKRMEEAHLRLSQQLPLLGAYPSSSQQPPLPCPNRSPECRPGCCLRRQNRILLPTKYRFQIIL